MHGILNPFAFIKNSLQNQLSVNMTGTNLRCETKKNRLIGLLLIRNRQKFRVVQRQRDEKSEWGYICSRIFLQIPFPCCVCKYGKHSYQNRMVMVSILMFVWKCCMCCRWMPGSIFLLLHDELNNICFPFTFAHEFISWIIPK